MGGFVPDKGKRAMLTTDQINDLHHLYWVEHWSIRKIEQHLSMSWRTIKKYLQAPAQTSAARSRVSLLWRAGNCHAELDRLRPLQERRRGHSELHPRYQSKEREPAECRTITPPRLRAPGPSKPVPSPIPTRRPSGF